MGLMKPKTLDEVTKDYVLHILSGCETKKEAAELLGVSDKTITNYLQKWGLKFDRWAYHPEQKLPPNCRCPHCGTTELLCGYNKMALETLKEFNEINGFEVRRCCEDMGIPIPMYLAGSPAPIYIDDDANIIGFRIQKGQIKENGVNGCQLDTLIETARLMILSLNKKFHSVHNTEALVHLNRALDALERRKIDRIARGVEGENKM
jgi:hypothetical protein